MALQLPSWHKIYHIMRQTEHNYSEHQFMKIAAWWLDSEVERE